MVQIGWYARNYRAIYQINSGHNRQKIHLLQDRPWIREAMAKIDKFSPTRHRPDAGEVLLQQRISNELYDNLLTQSIIFCEYFDVSASNTVIEAVARNCPIVVNHKPALVEYLGHDYPLFYRSLEEAEKQIQDESRILAAYQYLCELPKGWLNGSTFSDKVTEFCMAVGR